MTRTFILLSLMVRISNHAKHDKRKKVTMRRCHYFRWAVVNKRVYPPEMLPSGDPILYHSRERARRVASKIRAIGSPATVCRVEVSFRE